MLERGAVCKKTAGARSGGVGWSAGAAIKNRLERGAEGGAEVKKGRSAGALIPLDPPTRRMVSLITTEREGCREAEEGQNQFYNMTTY